MTGIKVEEKRKENKNNKNNMRGNDLIFTLRERFIFAINKLSRMRESNSERPLAKTEKSSKEIGCPVSLLCAKMLDKEDG